MNDYSYLIGFILSNKELGTKKKFAEFLGISPQNLQQKLNGKGFFTHDQINKVRNHFSLTPDETILYFFK
jgi:hypothetical protein